MKDDKVVCELCGEPMPKGEEMFKYHGYSGPCPKPPLPRGTGWTSAEEAVISSLMESQGLSRMAVLRQALRTYQLVATGHAKLVMEVGDKKCTEERQ